MAALVASVAADTVLLTLLIATGEHLSKPAVLRNALIAHRVVPAPGAVAVLVVAAEGLLGLVGLVALLRDDGGRLLGVVLAGCSVLFAAYAGYGWHLTATRRTVPCGCSRVELPMTGWVVGRAAALAGLALVGSLLSGAVLPLDRADPALAIVLLAAAAFAVLLTHLPAAMHDPTPDEAAVRVTGGGVPG